jgi:hypothetical protein
MALLLPRHEFVSGYTPWHITFGTYGTRLHGSAAPTVDKSHNELAQPFLRQNEIRVACERQRMKFPPRHLTHEQRESIETETVAICERGGWQYRICAAQNDHVHVLCDVLREIHGEKVRRLIKRWLGQALSSHLPLPSGATWWAEEGSNIAIHDEKYLNNCYAYIDRQRATPQRAGASPPPTQHGE